MEVLVGIGEYRVANPPSWVVTRGLGSCVGVTIYNSIGRVGGLAHVMLPSSKDFRSFTNPYKFADLAVRALYNEVRRNGGPQGLQAKLVGGARMFSYRNEAAGFDIGTRNVLEVRNALAQLGVRVIAEEIGGSWGRTAILDVATGQVLVKTVGKGELVI